MSTSATTAKQTWKTHLSQHNTIASHPTPDPEIPGDYYGGGPLSGGSGAVPPPPPGTEHFSPIMTADRGLIWGVVFSLAVATYVGLTLSHHRR